MKKREEDLDDIDAILDGFGEESGVDTKRKPVPMNK
jgi:hypothetical protein